jgi:uncharacterized alkaline shock family protein YloU
MEVSSMFGNDRVGASDSRLRCGQDIDDLLAQVSEGQPPTDPEHQRSCPHCRAALAELESLWRPIRALADEEVRAPAEILDQVMAQVRELLRQGWYAVIPSPEGDTRIAARVIAAVARLAAEQVPGVSLALGGGRATETDVGVAGPHVVVDVDVMVEMGTPIPTTSHALRRQIAEDIAAHTGLRAAEVNIAVIDVAHSAEFGSSDLSRLP